jgi:hypothetical protein
MFVYESAVWLATSNPQLTSGTLHDATTHVEIKWLLLVRKYSTIIFVVVLFLSLWLCLMYSVVGTDTTTASMTRQPANQSLAWDSLAERPSHLRLCPRLPQLLHQWPLRRTVRFFVFCLFMSLYFILTPVLSWNLQIKYLPICTAIDCIVNDSK